MRARASKYDYDAVKRWRGGFAESTQRRGVLGVQGMPEDTPALESGAARACALARYGCQWWHWPGWAQPCDTVTLSSCGTQLGAGAGECTSDEAGWCSTVTVSSWFKLSLPLSLDAGGCGWVGCRLVRRHVVSALVAVIKCIRPCEVGCG